MASQRSNHFFAVKKQAWKLGELQVIFRFLSLNSPISLQRSNNGSLALAALDSIYARRRHSTCVSGSKCFAASRETVRKRILVFGSRGRPKDYSMQSRKGKGTSMVIFNLVFVLLLRKSFSVFVVSVKVLHITLYFLFWFISSCLNLTNHDVFLSSPSFQGKKC